jgi:hypothetical protein
MKKVSEEMVSFKRGDQVVTIKPEGDIEVIPAGTGLVLLRPNGRLSGMGKERLKEFLGYFWLRQLISDWRSNVFKNQPSDLTPENRTGKTPVRFSSYNR